MKRQNQRGENSIWQNLEQATSRQEFQISLQNRFSVLPILDNVDQDINSIWEKTKTAIIETYKETIGYVQHKRKKWMSDGTWARLEERRQAKQKVLNATRFQKRQGQDFYKRMDREVKKICKKDKGAYTEHLAKEAETACGKGDLKYLYNITRQLSGRPPITNSQVKDRKGNVISKNELKRWKEHFQKVLNRPSPIITPDIEEGQTLDMERAIRQLKMGKSGGVDNIPPEVIKAMDNISVNALHHLINRMKNKYQMTGKKDFS
jgi:hypothetical protein